MTVVPQTRHAYIIKNDAHWLEAGPEALFIDPSVFIGNTWALKFRSGNRVILRVEIKLYKSVSGEVAALAWIFLRIISPTAAVS